MIGAMQKSYLPTEHGQIHVRALDADGEATRPPLVCLHPAPYSGAYYETVMPLLNEGRLVIAPDYPGYGGSYPLDEPPSIADYAAAVLAVIGDEPVDLMGFHSGALVAVESSLLAPERIRRLLLIDVPYLDAETQQKFYSQVAKPLALDHELDCLDKAWDFNVASRKDIVPLDRAFDLFVDQLVAGRRDYYCFHAAFTYDCVARFAEVTTPTTIVATRSPLLDATQAASQAIPAARLIDVTDITTSVFEQGAPVIARRINVVLNDG